MATSSEFMNFFMEYAGDNISVRKMMGEYLLYYKGKIIGDICDNKVFVKITPRGENLLKKYKKDYPYNGSKTLMAVIDDFECNEQLEKIFEITYSEL